MKTKNYLIIVWCCLTTLMYGQGQPSHPMYINPGDSWVDILDSWEPGKVMSKKVDYSDDNFFISRVRLKERFENKKTQVNPELTTERKHMWWCPIGEFTKEWGPLPRYNFEADNFNMWQYVDIHGNWSNGWIRVPGAFNDAAHKNGVATGCLYFVNWADAINSGTKPGKDFGLISKKNPDGTFKYSRKLIKMLKYYGIDGLGINPEGYWNEGLARQFQDFLADCHKVAKEEGWPFRVDWYASNTNNGNLNFNGNVLNDNNRDWFQKGDDKRITDMFMLNYNWPGDQVAISVENAKKYGRSSYDVYAGFDIEGRAWHNNAGANGGWKILAEQPASICIWGNHAMNMLHNTSAELGSTDLSIQNTYLKKLELVFTGGTRNPINTPAITNSVSSHSLKELENFHGFSKLMPARSTLQEIPFVTRFNLGNGMYFKNNGVTTFDKKWYNLGIQDYLPTWRWWISDSWTTNHVPAKPIMFDLNFEDAWVGGSCLKIHGETESSKIRLFKTKFDVKPNFKLSITYKVTNGIDPKIKLALSKAGSENEFATAKLPSAEESGKWKTVTMNLSDFNIQAGNTIACIGMEIEGTTASHEVLIGEMSLIDPSKIFVPVKPTITKTEVLGGVFNAADLKVIFQCGDKNMSDDGRPIYNDEVDSWYFEIYTKQDGKEPVLCTATTSWAAYVVGAPVDPADTKVKIGVCAVAPDGITRSEIAWSESLTRKVNPLETVTINKPVIKPNETFTVKYNDYTHVPAKWEIINAMNGSVVATQDGAIQYTTSLPELGTYDLKVSYGDKVSLIRGFIQVTPIATGSVPVISSLVADKTNPAVNENIKLNYTSKDGEGSVSRALHLSDVQSFTLPNALMNKLPFTFSFWMKTDGPLVPSAEGSTLLGQRNYNDSWPQSGWGDLWLDIMGDYKLNFNVQNSGDNLQTPGYFINPATWTHVVISAESNKRRIFFNGKLVSEMTGKNTGYGSRGGDIHFGGGAPNRSGFVGLIDEVQVWNKALSADEVIESMQGYDEFELPKDGLVGYWNFESELTNEAKFLNIGSNSAVAGTLTVTEQVQPEGSSKYITADKIVNTPSFAAGVPALEGVLPITTTAKWNVPGSEPVISGKQATASYAAAGTYDVKLTLTNIWGSAQELKSEYIVVGGGSSVDKEIVENYTVYPNPFAESVNLQFATEGNYMIKVFNTSGQLIQQQNYAASSTGETVNLKVDGSAGLYFVNVFQDGKCLKVFKISKK